jgi:hypothetical protein
MTTAELLPREDVKCYDNTRVSAYKTCPRMYLLRHQLHWRPEGTAIALSFGLSWHDAQDIVWGYAKKFTVEETAALAFEVFKKTWAKEGLPVEISLEKLGFYEPRTPGIAAEMLYNYTDTRWKMLQECDVVAIEKPFAVPIPGMPGHWYIGRLDKVVDYNAQRLVIEHKSTTAYATAGGFRTDFLDSWYMSAQVKGYQFGGGLFYGNINAVWVDAALVHKKVHDAFRFVPVAHNFALLSEWLDNTKKWIAEISAEEDLYADVKRLLPGMFKRNDESCYGKYGACSYIDICRSIPDPSVLEEPPPGFVVEKWEPFDILGFNKLLGKEKADGA